MESVRDWLERRGVGFYIVIAPDKNTIFPEKLPDYPRRPGGTTRFDQLVERLQRSNLEFVDPRSALLAAKAKDETVYIESDTHWTERGALIAYSLLMERIKKRFPNIDPLTLASFTVGKGKPMANDLLRSLALEDDISYSVERFVLRHRRQVGNSTRSMRPGWGWPLAEIKNDLQHRPRLLVFGNSFTDYVLGPYFLYETFRDPVWTHHNGGTFNLRLVDEFKPDLVVVQIADRYLRLVPLTSVGFDAADPK